VREVHLPAALPDAGDDFDWRVRDYDGFRIFMLEELAARFPERKRWTPADIEVVLVEVMAAVLDQLSDMLDRVAAERFLETARRPETVRQLLGFIGYDAVAAAKGKDLIPSDLSAADTVTALDRYWNDFPHAMQQAKREGPREIHTQKRMVTVEDYALRLREHPLVLHAHAWSEWIGSWFTIRLAVIAWGNLELDQVPGSETDGEIAKEFPEELCASVANFYELKGLNPPDMKKPQPTMRMILRTYVDAMRMVGQEVVLDDPIYVGIYISISVSVAANYFQSEIQHAISQILGHGPSGFFEPGRLGFGEDVYAADIIQALMALDGIEHVCLNRFKRIGSQYPDRAKDGFIPLDGLEVAVCDNQADNPSGGYFRFKLHGGQRG
jgi:hypothetical protein